MLDSRSVGTGPASSMASEPTMMAEPPQEVIEEVKVEDIPF